MVNTQMLDRLMKPIIEEDLKKERTLKERELLNEALPGYGQAAMGTTQQQQAGTEPARVKMVDGSWHAFIYNPNLYTKYNYDFVTYALSLGQRTLGQGSTQGNLITNNYNINTIRAWANAKANGATLGNLIIPSLQQDINTYSQPAYKKGRGRRKYDANTVITNAWKAVQQKLQGTSESRLNNLMKPLIEEDNKAYYVRRAEKNIGSVRGLDYETEYDVLKKYYYENFKRGIDRAISDAKRYQNHGPANRWLTVIDATIKMYEIKFKLNKGDYESEPTTMPAIMQHCSRAFIKDAFSKHNHTLDFRYLVWLRSTLSSYLTSTGYYATDSKYRSTKSGRRDPYTNFNFKDSQDKHNEKLAQQTPVGTERMFEMYSRLKQAIRDGVKDWTTLNMAKQHLQECITLMEKEVNNLAERGATTEGVKRNVSGLYKLIFETSDRRGTKEIEADLMPLLQGQEWVAQFKKAKTPKEKMAIINEMKRVLELLNEWHPAANDELKRPITSQDDNQNVDQQKIAANKLKRINNEWNSFIVNVPLAKDYNFDFKRFALTRGTFAADGKDPGMMNGYEGPKKSGTLKSTSFTPDDFNTWLEAKKNGNSSFGITSIYDDLKPSTTDYKSRNRMRHTAKVWEKTTGEHITVG